MRHPVIGTENEDSRSNRFIHKYRITVMVAGTFPLRTRLASSPQTKPPPIDPDAPAYPTAKRASSLFREPLLIHNLARVPRAGLGKIGKTSFFGHLSPGVVPHTGPPVGLGELRAQARRLLETSGDTPTLITDGDLPVCASTCVNAPRTQRLSWIHLECDRSSDRVVPGWPYRGICGLLHRGDRSA